MSAVEVRGQIGPDGPALLVLYTGGTFGMGQDADGSLVPLDLRRSETICRSFVGCLSR